MSDAGLEPAGDAPLKALAPVKPMVLVVEDDLAIRRFLRASLDAEGYRLVEAGDGAGGLVEFLSRLPDVTILDLGLPDTDGIHVLEEIRRHSALPVIVLSARGQEPDKIAALDAGADDYVAKPFGMGELLARIRAALRRGARGPQTPDGLFRVGGLEVDLEGRLVRLDGEVVRLTPIEYRLLTVLIQHAGKVLTHRMLLTEVWGPQSVDQAQYLRVYMGQLRRKLEKDSTAPRFLLTEPGVGYRLVAGEGS